MGSGARSPAIVKGPERSPNSLSRFRPHTPMKMAACMPYKTATQPIPFSQFRGRIAHRTKMQATRA